MTTAQSESSLSPNQKLRWHLDTSVRPFVISLAESFESILRTDDKEIKKAYLDQMEGIADAAIRILRVCDRSRLTKIFKDIYRDLNQ